MNTAQKIGKHIRETLPSKYIGLQVLGTDVPHSHIHIIPFNTTSEFYNQHRHPASHEELDKVCQILRIN